MDRRKFLVSAGIGCAGSLLSNISPSIVMAQSKATLYTQGRFLYNHSGQKVILNGVNLPLLDNWEFQTTGDKLDEIAKTGANAVRIQWYKDYPSRPPYSLADLDKVLNRCKEYKIIPIVMLSDSTCKSDLNLLNNQLVPWWTRRDVLAVLKKHQSYLIINLANELGNYRWTNNQPAALVNFKNAYKNAIARIRRHLHVPIMIDAPDCGASIEIFPLIGQELIDSDPDRNLLFSSHAYWAGYDGLPHIQKMINANLPLIFGEIANKQDENGKDGSTQYCYYDLDGIKKNHPPIQPFTYQSLLPILNQQEIGWLAWSWWKDRCSDRQMTTDGNFATLTTYGNDLVNNSTYGLKVIAKRLP